MNEGELIKIMYDKKFSKREIYNLKRVSEKYTTSLYEIVLALSQRFFKSLFLHILAFVMLFHTYLRYSEQQGHNITMLIGCLGTLAITYIILDFIAPLLRGYKARKVMKEIKKRTQSLS